MGVGGNFWSSLKPYARREDLDFLRNKRVAIDLSFWIVQQETALRNRASNPHIRLTFFRTVNLFSKFGAYPVFVVDGLPSPLKARARIQRFFRGIDLGNLRVVEGDGDCASVERNEVFRKCVRECVELLQILGMPVLKAASEAEALCAQLNNEGHVDAVFTSDSDAFLYGAKCVIKCLHPNSKDPFECYHMSDIEAGLGLKRMHLVAISLLVGNDHDMNGVPGIGIETALSFVRMFPEEDILNRLHEMGKGEFLLSLNDDKSPSSSGIPSSNDNSPKTKSPHCSHCGHPGSKRAHLKVACEYCCVSGNENCLKKAVGFRCECPSCIKDRSSKAHDKQENWIRSICSKISVKKDFPNDEIIKMYLGHDQDDFTDLCAGDKSPCLSWRSPDVETVIDFLGYHQHWDPSYVRQRILPMLSTIFLREMASNPTEGSLLHEQYEFNSIQRVKIRYGHPFYLVSWRRVGPAVGSVCSPVQNEQVTQQKEFMEAHEQIDSLDEADVPEILSMMAAGFC
ncbi:hypothetical protein Syun_012947 [Stephania yunnanensis]|uniref:Flap endonuclease GEN-like 1 n=1 Tax=Stephania yunnanensis TaxID=152371 RepID=A0AAP0K0F2_9MAGN